MVIAMKRLAPIAVLLLLSTQPHARLAPGAVDPVLHAWFERQHSRDGALCCDVADGYLVDDDDWRHSQDGQHYEVKIRGGWRTIQSRWLRRTDEPNPTGKAIVWYRFSPDEAGLSISCFAPGYEG